MLNIHAFDEKIEELIKQKLKISLIFTPKTPTLKEKLYKKQGGKCIICDKFIDYDMLQFKIANIYHINPIKKGENKFSLKNLVLTHSWCHRKHNH